jgi:hypothetical protein
MNKFILIFSLLINTCYCEIINRNCDLWYEINDSYIEKTDYGFSDNDSKIKKYIPVNYIAEITIIYDKLEYTYIKDFKYYVFFVKTIDHNIEVYYELKYNTKEEAENDREELYWLYNKYK